MTPSEQKIVRLLLAEYPTSGLGSATRLAKRATVSDPTVARLVTKLGFASFADFQKQLLAEVEERVHSPLHMIETKRGAEKSGVTLGYLASTMEALRQSQTLTPIGAYEQAARLIMDAKGEVVLVGGRFSRFAAGMLAEYLRQMRAGVRSISDLSASAFDTLADLSRKDVVIVFEYRRYQYDVTSYARQAAEQGARVILFTDQWLSPISAVAEVVIISRLDVESPFDTMAPAVAQLEAVVANILAVGGELPLTRMRRFEEVRSTNKITFDAASDKHDPMGSE